MTLNLCLTFEPGLTFDLDPLQWPGRLDGRDQASARPATGGHLALPAEDGAHPAAVHHRGGPRTGTGEGEE